MHKTLGVQTEFDFFFLLQVTRKGKAITIIGNVKKNFNDYLTLTIKAKLLIQFTLQSWSDITWCAVVKVLVVEVVLVAIRVVGAVAGFVG